MNHIDTYRQVVKENEHADYAHQETANAHRNSLAAVVHKTVSGLTQKGQDVYNRTFHEIAARSHDSAMDAHKKAAGAAGNESARKYHEHMVKHHEFLKGHHGSMV